MTSEFEAINASVRSQESEEHEARVRAAREARMQAKRDLELPHLKKIAEHLSAMAENHKSPGSVIVDEDAVKLYFLGVDLSYSMDFVEEWTNRGSWHSKPTGRHRIVVGDYGNRKSYPVRKDGSYNYASMAEALYGIAVAEYRHRTARDTREANKSKAQEWLKERDLATYGYFGPSSNADRPISFSKELKVDLTPEQADKLLAVLDEIGVSIYRGYKNDY